jgi:hypothetical protein
MRRAEGFKLAAQRERASERYPDATDHIALKSDGASRRITCGKRTRGHTTDTRRTIQEVFLISEYEAASDDDDRQSPRIDTPMATDSVR